MKKSWNLRRGDLDMGYYSELRQDLVIKEALIPKLRKEIEKRKEIMEKNNEYIVWHIGTMEVDNDGALEWEDTNCKWYESEKLAVFLAKYVNEGKMVFIGEDGERWGFWFDGEGHAYWLVFPAPVKTDSEVM
jgi:hypothetical protein